MRERCIEPTSFKEVRGNIVVFVVVVVVVVVAKIVIIVVVVVSVVVVVLDDDITLGPFPVEPRRIVHPGP